MRTAVRLLEGSSRMANKKQLAMLQQDVDAWNDWRKKNPDEKVDLTGATLRGASLNFVNLRNADLTGADLSESTIQAGRLDEACLKSANLRNACLSESLLIKANLSDADLTGGKFYKACFRKANLNRAKLTRAFLSSAIFQHALLNKTDLCEATLTNASLENAQLQFATLKGASLLNVRARAADFSQADLTNSNLSGASISHGKFRQAKCIKTNFAGADLSGVDFVGANLRGADLRAANVVGANFENAILSDARIYGISAWDTKLEGTIQLDLIITQETESDVTVDDLQVAQFVYLLLNNKNIRSVIDTVGKKGVLILGRFTPERKAVLDAVRDKLRQLDYVPMMFDFDKPTDKDFTETIMTLAGLSLFIIADITNPKSSPLELQATVPNYMVPFVPIIQEGEKPFSMFKDLYGKFDWVLKPLEYNTAENLVEKLEKGVINRALEKHKELMLRKAAQLQIVKLEDL